MKKKYSLLILLLMTLISVSLVSCGDNDSESSDNNDTTSFGIACDVADDGYCSESTFDPSSLETCAKDTEVDSCSTTNLVGTCSSIYTTTTESSTVSVITLKMYYYTNHETVTTCNKLELACTNTTVEVGDSTLAITEATAECAE